MKILQNTTDFTNEKIREIIDFVKPNNLPTSKFDVRVTGLSDGTFTGYAIPSRERPVIVLRIGRNEKKFPHYRDYTPKVRRPWRKVILYFEKFNEKTRQYETWHESMPYQSIKDMEKKISYGGYISKLILCREEALVSIAAHELRHLWHKNHPGKRGKVWGARGKYSERDADAYAIRKQRKWRKIHAPTEVYPEYDNILFLQGA
jgi:hypothetical protein